jgi:ligand-binding sensor domain-containing protein/signal transduction histidine kinase
LRNSNTCREVWVAERRLLKACLAVLAGLCLVVPAKAIDPGRMISQYIHDHWGSEKGFNGGAISSFAQSADGYLWMGTEKGLIRFDGLSFHLFQQAMPTSFPIGAVQALKADAQGNLWVLLQSTKILRYHDGRFDLGNEEAEFGITSVGSRADGTVLFSSLALGTLTYRAGKFVPLVAGGQMAPSASVGAENADNLTTRLSWATGVTPHRFAEPNSAVIVITETADGKVWLGTRDKGLFYMSAGRVIAAPGSPSNRKINCILALENQNLLIGTDVGMFLWNGREVTSQGIPGALRKVQVVSTLRDRDANIWVGTPGGLIRLAVDKGSLTIAESDSRTIGAATALFEDREGNLWLGSPAGLDRLRDSAFLTYSIPGLQSESTGPVYPDSGDRIWFGPIEGGLQWFKGGKTAKVANDGLAQDVVYSIAGNQNEVWIGRQHGGLTRLQASTAGITTKTHTTADGLAQNSVYAVFESRDGAVWAGTLSGGVSEFRNGRFKTYTAADGLASDTISAIAESSDHTMWFATPNGLSALSGGQWRTYRVAEGLPSANVNCVLPDENGTVWIGTATGLAALRAGHVQVPAPVHGELHEQILGIAEDKNGWLWISTSNQVLRVQSEKLLSGALTDDDVHIYGEQDGLRGTEGVKRSPSVAEDHSGKIWFSMNRGIAVVDPTRAINNSPPALVHVEVFSADGNAVDAQKNVRLRDPHRRITFNYTALSLSVPERIRYRYKLDGLDEGWSDPVTANEVTYNNLSAGKYRFRVIASNSDGLWNGQELAIPFEIAPAYWQTWWFRLSAVVVVALAMLLFFRLRVLRLTHQMNMRFEERLAERTRIAQELHDTLLQGFLSASMQLHVADDHLASESPAKPFVGRVLDLMGRVIDEGRNAVRGLRLPDQQSQSLEQAFSGIQQELEISRASGFRVFAEGEERRLRPAIRETVYRIGREAVINAFRHAHAGKIEVELRYAASHLRLLVRDNGVGIDQQVVRAGRDGHWGLSGMRERADEIGARLRVLSSPAAGTEVELSVPSRIAFEPRRSNNRWAWLAKLKLRMVGEANADVESEKQK